MAERDAFGRGRDEDTLVDMGWREPGFVATLEGATTAPEAAFVAATSPTAEQPRPAPAAAPKPPRRARRRPRVMSRVLFLGIVAASALFALREGTGFVGDIEDAIRGRTGTITRTVPVEGGSLLHAKAFAAALEGLPAGDVEMLRLTPEELDAQVIVDGRRHSVRVSASGRVIDVPTPGGARLAPIVVESRAPARIIRAATRDRSSVDYLVLLRIAGRPRWQLFLEDGRSFTANEDGRSVRAFGASLRRAAG
jgi:hypothetical protein